MSKCCMRTGLSVAAAPAYAPAGEDTRDCALVLDGCHGDISVSPVTLKAILCLAKIWGGVR